MRSVVRLEGLASSGAATVGPLRLALPAVLEAGETPTSPLGPRLTAAPAAPGQRRLAFTDGSASWEVVVPVLAPEVVPSPGGIHPTSEARVALAHAPFTPEALARLRETDPELVILGNARALWNEGEPFVDALRGLREGVGAEPLLWAPRVGLPHRLPLLAYLGVDLVDTTEGLMRAEGGTYFDLTMGVRDARPEEGERACPCPSCATAGANDLVGHARWLFGRSLAETRSALRAGRLRELVEARVVAEPANAEHLRYADRLLGAQLEERAPVAATGTRTYVLAESHRRPEMERFRRRLLTRYRPPPSKTVLWLVPCSKTKPYRVSPSHRRFVRALEGLPSLERVHLVSVSSPLGVVPRELEDVPPARHYDVPVTGEWTASEAGWVNNGLAHLLRTGHYTDVVAHLDPEEYAFLRDVLPSSVRTVWTVNDHRTTSGEALDRLRREMQRILAATPHLPGGFRTSALEELAGLAQVQFGAELSERLLAPPVRLVGRPWFLRLTDGRQDLATVREERGLLHLTVAGAVRVGETMPRVDAEPSLELKGDLFVPGVVHADPAIRAGDSVGIFQGGRLAGVGEAALPGRLMVELRRGVAVKGRHHRHAGADTAKTEEPPAHDDGPVVEG